MPLARSSGDGVATDAKCIRGAVPALERWGTVSFAEPDHFIFFSETDESTQAERSWPWSLWPAFFVSCAHFSGYPRFGNRKTAAFGDSFSSEYVR